MHKAACWTVAGLLGTPASALAQEAVRGPGDSPGSGYAATRLEMRLEQREEAERLRGEVRAHRARAELGSYRKHLRATSLGEREESLSRSAGWVAGRSVDCREHAGIVPADLEPCTQRESGVSLLVGISVSSRPPGLRPDTGRPGQLSGNLILQPSGNARPAYLPRTRTPED